MLFPDVSGAEPSAPAGLITMVALRTRSATHDRLTGPRPQVDNFVKKLTQISAIRTCDIYPIACLAAAMARF